MWDMNDVVDITYVSGYTYHVTFDDGLHGDVDFSEYPQKRPEFAPLPPSIARPNGADVAPESTVRKTPWEREAPASPIDPEDQQ